MYLFRSVLFSARRRDVLNFEVTKVEQIEQMKPSAQTKSLSKIRLIYNQNRKGKSPIPAILQTTKLFSETTDKPI